MPLYHLSSESSFATNLSVAVSHHLNQNHLFFNLLFSFSKGIRELERVTRNRLMDLD